MEAAKSIYSNALDEIFYEFEQKMSKGMGYDLLQSKYTRTKEEDDRFLDGVNRFVETQTLNNKLESHSWRFVADLRLMNHLHTSYGFR